MAVMNRGDRSGGRPYDAAMIEPLTRLLRFDAPAAAATLPSEIAARAAREPLALHQDGTGWRAEVRLPRLERRDLVVPSLVLGTHIPERYDLRFRWTGATIDLAPIALRPDLVLDGPPARLDTVGARAGRAIGGLDCMEVVEPIADCVLEVAGTGPVPEDAVLLVSVRTRRIDPVDTGARAPDLDVPGRSQMTHSAEIARHICSPISVCMVMARADVHPDPETFARASEHPHHSKLFGLWPLNLARARSAGFSGCVRIFDDVSEAARLLELGYPIVTSIRFEAGALPGAPLPRTSGHLVVLRGLGARDVLVNDPAAPDDAAVPHRYDRASFLRAWLSDRGVAYVLWPAAVTDEAA